MLNNTSIPFFPLKINEKNQTWTINNPLTDIEYELGYDGYCLLSLCNGYNTWAEITTALSKIFQISAKEVNSHSETIMEDFTNKGIIWWRKERMQIWQTTPPVSVIWDLTYKCNLACHHCVVKAGVPRASEANSERK